MDDLNAKYQKLLAKYSEVSYIARLIAHPLVSVISPQLKEKNAVLKTAVLNSPRNDETDVRIDLLRGITIVTPSVG
jgi:hypothetical protein